MVERIMFVFEGFTTFEISGGEYHFAFNPLVLGNKKRTPYTRLTF